MVGLGSLWSDWRRLSAVEERRGWRLRAYIKRERPAASAAAVAAAAAGGRGFLSAVVLAGEEEDEGDPPSPPPPFVFSIYVRDPAGGELLAQRPTGDRRWERSGAGR